ncbi:MAG TPA: helix-turn-helix domain-containing protein, partial [Armatimonadota bacterium]|nr:helix-turn-helix domain-containing protein [Armatimonadota bacterium]
MIQVIGRAVELLDLIALRAYTLTELSRETGLHKTTVFNVLLTLESLGLVSRDTDKRYSIGAHLVSWAEPILRKGTLTRAAEQAASLLAARIRETVHVAILSNRQRLIIARVDSTQAVTANGSDVERRRLYNGASGPVLLAHLDRDELDDIVRCHGLPGEEWDGISSYSALRVALRRVRDDGILARLVGDDQAQILAVPVFGP